MFQTLIFPKLYKDWVDVINEKKTESGYFGYGLVLGVLTIYNQQSGDRKWQLDDVTGYWTELEGSEPLFAGKVPIADSKASINCINCDWTAYQGFTEAYYYCTKCDRRKND